LPYKWKLPNVGQNGHPARGGQAHNTESQSALAERGLRGTSPPYM
jgi:hypothetical protein